MRIATRNPRVSFFLVIAVIIVLALPGCATPPPEPPPEREPAPEPAPESPPEPEPEPEPPRTAPLVGTLWELAAQFGSEDIPRPPRRTVQFRFEAEENRLVVDGPVNQLIGTYRYDLLESTLDNTEYEEGTLALRELARTRRSGRYMRYEDRMVRNMSLIQGYYITGTPAEESVLTIFGGHGREEIILFELAALEVPEQR